MIGAATTLHMETNTPKDTSVKLAPIQDPTTKKDVTRKDIKKGSTKNKDWSCFHYKEKDVCFLMSINDSLSGTILSALK